MGTRTHHRVAGLSALRSVYNRGVALVVPPQQGGFRRYRIKGTPCIPRDYRCRQALHPEHHELAMVLEGVVRRKVSGRGSWTAAAAGCEFLTLHAQQRSHRYNQGTRSHHRSAGLSARLRFVHNRGVTLVAPPPTGRRFRPAADIAFRARRASPVTTAVDSRCILLM